MNIFFMKVSLSALLTFLREQKKQMHFLLPNNFFMSLEAIVKLLAGRLAIKVTKFSMFELTLLPFFYCNESNSENASLWLCELVSTLLDGETEEDNKLVLSFVKMDAL